MKIIHCADLHLDSKMNRYLDKETAKNRRYELVSTFSHMVEYAKDENVEAIIIAGDLFDTRTILASTKNAIINEITMAPQIDFYYLLGNHSGGAEFLESMESIPENLKLFSDTWKYYEAKENTGIIIGGIELSSENKNDIYSSLFLDPRNFNIITLHGQLSDYQSKKDGEVISLSELKNKNIDYLALGHIHEYQEGSIPPRGMYCYPGCLEGRGFDECGEHGFVLLDIDEENHEMSTEFVPIAKRRIFEVEVDITGLSTTPQIMERINEETTDAGCAEKDLVKVVLTGSVDVDCEKDADYIAKQLNMNFYFAKVYDHSRIAVDYNDYAYDASLKGEFVRLIQGDPDMDDDTKAEIIRCGIQALNGEEIEV